MFELFLRASEKAKEALQAVTSNHSSNLELKTKSYYKNLLVKDKLTIITRRTI